jgi:hypothetical protein
MLRKFNQVPYGFGQEALAFWPGANPKGESPVSLRFSDRSASAGLMGALDDAKAFKIQASPWFRSGPS